MDDLDAVQRIDEVAPPSPPPATTVDRINAALAGVAPEQGRDEAMRQATEAARRQFQGRSQLEQLNEFNLMNVVPFASPIAKGVLRSQAAESEQRIKSGTYDDQDLSRAAYWRVRDEAEANQGFGRKLVGAGGKAVGMLGEAYLTAGLGNVIPGGSGAVPALASGTGRLALQTAAMPSLYVEGAQQRAEQQGGSALDAKNIGPAYVEGMITNRILGTLGKPAEALAASRFASPAARFAVRAASGAALMPAEQQIADTATSMTDALLPDAYKFNTRYGLLGDLLNGKEGEAGQHFAIQAITGGVFAAAHTPGAEAERRAAFQDELTRVNAKLAAMAKRGMSSQRVFETATREMGGERAAEAAQITKQAAAQVQNAPGPTPPTAPAATAVPQPATIAPPEGASTPPEAPRASETIPESEKPQAPAPSGAAGARAGAPPSRAFLKGLVDAGVAGSQAEAAAMIERLPPDVAESMRQQFEGKAPPPAKPSGKGATFEEPAPRDAFDLHPDREPGAVRLLAEMKASPEYADVAKAIPEGSKPIGKPNAAYVFETPDGKIVRVAKAGERPDLPEMIQPLDVKRIGGWQVETLPKADHVGDPDLFKQHAEQLVAAAEKAGWRRADVHPENFGMVDGKPVMIDPGTVRRPSPREAELMAKGQAPAARPSPPEPAARSWRDVLADKAKEIGQPIERTATQGEAGRARIGGKWYEAVQGPEGWLAREVDIGPRERRSKTIKDRYGIDVEADARELGVSTATYHDLAEHNLSQQWEHDKEHNALLRDALDSLDANAKLRGARGSVARFLAANEARGGRNATEDSKSLDRDRIDNVAEQSALDYPQHYRDAAGDKEHLKDQLFEKIREGKRKPKVEEAYRAAYAEIEAANKEFKDATEAHDRSGEAGPSGEEIVRGGESAADAHARGDADDAGLSAAGFDFPFGAEDPSPSPSPAEGQAKVGDVGAAAAKRAPVAAARESDVGPAPTPGEVIRSLDSDAFKAKFEGNRSRLAIAESIARRLAGQEPDEGAGKIGKRFGMSDSALLKAEANILEKAGFKGHTMQTIRDAEQADRARLHQAERDPRADPRVKPESAEGLASAPPGGERADDLARDRVTDKLLAGHSLTAEDMAVFGRPISTSERRETGIGGVHGQFGVFGNDQGPPMRETALANAVVDRERAKRGEPPLITAARKAFGASWDEAMSRLDKDPQAAVRLIDQLTAKPRLIDDVESSLLMHRQVVLHNEHERAMEQYTRDLQRNFAEGADKETADQRQRDRQMRVQELRRQLNQLDQVTKAAGTQNARALAIRAQLVKEDFSLTSMIRQAEAARGRPLTDAEESQVREMQKKVADLQTKLDAAEAKRAEVQTPAPASREAGLWRRATEWFKGLFGEENKSPADKPKPALWQAADRWEKEATAELAAKLGTDKLFAGFDPTLIPPLAKFVAAKIVKGGYSFAEFSKAIVGRFGKDVEPHVDDIWRRAEAMAKEPEPRAIGQYHSQERADLERAKQEFQASLNLAEAKSAPLWSRALDYGARFERGMILSSPMTLVKLTSAAVQKMVLTPLEELAGSVIGKVAPGLAARAPREGGFSFKAEAKAITGLFTTGMRDAAETLRTGKSQLDVLYGKHTSELPPSLSRFMDFFGFLHGALKAPVKRAEFERSYQKRVEWGLKNGQDVNNPGIQMAIGVAAYKDANRAIFLSDNRVVDGYNKALQALEKPDPETGRVPVAGKLGATAARVALPVVRVPTNIVAETVTHLVGSVTGSAQAARAYSNGIASLKPGEADVIMRQLKKGSLGAAGLALGYLAANSVGGYYQHGQRRDEDDVGAGQARVFGVDVPKAMLHNPLLETLQVGATARRVAESGKKGQDPNGIAIGLMKALLGLAEEVPFVRETAEVEKTARNPAEGAKALGKRLVVPAGVSFLEKQFSSPPPAKPKGGRRVP